MDRLQEVNAKHEQLRELMHRHGADGLLLRSVRNIAWFTGGADASINTASDSGAYAILVTPQHRTIVTDHIEEPRIRAEDNLEAYGFEYDVKPWYARAPLSTPNMIVDADVESELQRLRWVLVEPEQERLRAVARDTAAAIEEAAREVQPGDSEYRMAARLDAACRARGGKAIVNLIGTDDRISSFRHPLPTGKKIDRYGMLVVCMRRHGLVVSATRLVHFGPLPSDLQEKLHKVAAVDAAVMAATRPGRTLGEVFDDLLAAYADQQETGQWTLHHQGGIAGYAPREHIATPGDETIVQSGQAYAWNPSIVGCKSEDTILIWDKGIEIVSLATDNWPMIEINVNGTTIKRPGILEL